MLETTATTTVRDVVAANHRAAAVFQKHGMDFCCGGNKAIADACREHGIDEARVLADLGQVTNPLDAPRFNAWPLDFLVDYIVQNHHEYIRGAVETLGLHAAKVARVHGEHHPEVIQIAAHFDTVAAELLQHMRKEEHVLFPYIRAIAGAHRAGRPVPPPPFGTIANPIRMMELEHQEAGDLMAAIRTLSSQFTPPADACTTYRVTYEELQEFEADLHQHVHLETTILFPKAIALEAEVLNTGR